MTDYLLKVSLNALVDRLRVLQSELTEENRHSDAMTIDFVIQIMSVDAYSEKLPGAYAPFPPLKDYAGNHIPTGLEQLQGEE